MKHLTFALLAAILAAPAAIANAQEPAIKPSPMQPQPEAQASDPLIQWKAGTMDVRAMLRQLDAAIAPSIVIGQGVGEKVARVDYNGRALKLSEFLDTLSQAAGLTWGFLNRDTIVVLPARPASARVTSRLDLGLAERSRELVERYLNSRPRTPGLGIPRSPLSPFVPNNPLVPGTPRLAPAPFNPDPSFGLGTRPGGGLPKDAIPHTFNGQRIYIVPLQAAIQAADSIPDAAPDSHEPSQH